MNNLPEPSVEPPEPTILTGMVTLSGSFSIVLRCRYGEGCTSQDEMIAHAKMLMLACASCEFDFVCLSNDVKMDGQNPMSD